MTKKTVGIRDLQQNAPAAVAKVRAGASLLVTDGGIAVARLVPFEPLGLEGLVATGLATPPSLTVKELLRTVRQHASEATLSATLRALRDDNRL